MSLPFAYLGSGWVQDSEDTRQLAQGGFAARFHLDPPDGSGRVTVQVHVQVLPSPAAAALALPRLVPPEADFDWLGSPGFGDASGAWLSKSGTSAASVARVANVIVSAQETGAQKLALNNVAGAGSVTDMVRYICDRVVSQAQ